MTCRKLQLFGHKRQMNDCWKIKLLVFMPPPTIGGRGIVFWLSICLGPSVRPLSVNSSFAWRNISALNRGISMKLDANILHVSVTCWKGFQGQRSRSRPDKCVNGGIRFDGLASRLTYLYYGWEERSRLATQRVGRLVQRNWTSWAPYRSLG